MFKIGNCVGIFSCPSTNPFFPPPLLWHGLGLEEVEAQLPVPCLKVERAEKASLAMFSRVLWLPEGTGLCSAQFRS